MNPQRPSLLQIYFPGWLKSLVTFEKSVWNSLVQLDTFCFATPKAIIYSSLDCKTNKIQIDFFLN